LLALLMERVFDVDFPFTLFLFALDWFTFTLIKVQTTNDALHAAAAGIKLISSMERERVSCAMLSLPRILLCGNQNCGSYDEHFSSET